MGPFDLKLSQVVGQRARVVHGEGIAGKIGVGFELGKELESARDILGFALDEQTGIARFEQSQVKLVEWKRLISLE
jgi:hypothetical protein